MVVDNYFLAHQKWISGSSDSATNIVIKPLKQSVVEILINDKEDFLESDDHFDWKMHKVMEKVD